MNNINFENSLFVMPLLVGFTFVIAAYLMLKFPPKEINYMYGYRTKNSMKTKERWFFSQIYSSKIMIYCGLSLMLLSVFGLLFKVSVAKGVFISTLCIIISVIVLYIKTEKAIKQNFKNEN